MDFRLKNRVEEPDARREKNPEVGEANEALLRKSTTRRVKVAS